MVNIRDWAKNKGIDPNKIKYDSKTKRVTVDGINYGPGTATYTTKLQAVSPSDTTTYYQPQKVRTGTAYNESALDTTYDKGMASRASAQKQEAKTKYMNVLSQGPGEFKYDPNKDVAYRSALANNRRQIQDAVNDNAEYMNERGLLNSTFTSDRANRIAADATNRFSSEIAPQLEQRAYDRFNQSWQNKLASVASMYGITKDEAAQMQEQVNRNEDIARNDKYRNQDRADQKARDAQTQSNWQTTFDTGQANRAEDIKRSDTQRKEDKAEAKANRAEDIKYRDSRDKVTDTQWNKQFNQGVLESNRNYSLASSRASSGGSGGSGSSTTGTNEISKPEKLSYEDAVDLINKGSNVMMMGSSPRITNRKGLIQTINSLVLSAADRQALLRNYGLTKEASVLGKDPKLQMARNNPDQLIRELVNKNYSNDDFNRKLIYYGLWDRAVQLLSS